jgi:DNA-binding MarR family transcriptional regulator
VPQRHPAKKQIAFPAEAAWRSGNMSRLLFSAAWLFDSRILDYVQRHGFPLLRMAHLHLPRNLDLEGTRLTDLAVRAEMSKQSIGEIIDQCVAMGLVARVPDKSDGRAKIVVFTPRGLHLLEVVHAALSFAEEEMRAAIGAQRTGDVMTMLTEYCEKILRTQKPLQTPRARLASGHRRGHLPK